MDIRFTIGIDPTVHSCRAVETLEPGEYEFVCTVPGCQYRRLIRSDGTTVVENPDDSVIHTGFTAPPSITNKN